ncbi:MAG: hypothetical protein ACOZNI_19435 [Myxococcota bacterium]
MTARLPLVLLLACSAKSDAPPPDDAPTPLVHTEVPVLVVREPERAAFVGDVDRVTVAGEVTPGSGDLTSLVANGQTFDVSPSGGAFEDTIPAAPGLLIVGTRVETADGERAVDGRAVLAGPVHDPGATLEESVKLQIGPAMLDDDDDDLDDLAAIAEMMVEDDAVADLLVGSQFGGDWYTITVTSASWGDVAADLVPGSGSLAITLEISNVWIDYYAEIDWYPDGEGSCWADAAVVDLDLDLEVDRGEVVASVTSVAVTLEGFGMTQEYFPDSFEDELAGYAEEFLADEIAAQVTDMVPGLVEEYLGAFAVDTEVSGLRFQMALASLRVASDGLRLTMDAATSGDVGIDLPPGAGSLRTDGDGPSFPLTETEPFAMAADDDFLNQLLFNMWASGLMHDIVFSGVELTALAGEIPAPLGPVAEAEVDVDLPPVFSEATYADQHFDLGIGEMRLRATREDGVLNDASVNVRTGGTLAFDDAGELAMSLDDRPGNMTLEVGMEAWPEALDPGDMAALVRLSVPPMLGTMSMFLPAFPVPTIPLDSFGLPGQELRVEDPTASVQDGWLVIEGTLTAE